MNIDKYKLLLLLQDNQIESTIRDKTILDIVNDCEIKPVDCNECERYAMRNNSYCNYCVHSDESSDMFVPNQDKIIDMSCLIGSDILCEFFITHNQAVIDRLIEIREDKPNKFVTDDDVYDNCRVMQNYWHSWQGGDNPLPEGLEVEVLLKEGTVQSGYTTETYSWNWCNDMTDIIAFRVTGVLKEFKYD